MEEYEPPHTKTITRPRTQRPHRQPLQHHARQNHPHPIPPPHLQKDRPINFPQLLPRDQHQRQIRAERHAPHQRRHHREDQSEDGEQVRGEEEREEEREERERAGDGVQDEDEEERLVDYGEEGGGDADVGGEVGGDGVA